MKNIITARFGKIRFRVTGAGGACDTCWGACDARCGACDGCEVRGAFGLRGLILLFFFGNE